MALGGLAVAGYLELLRAHGLELAAEAVEAVSLALQLEARGLQPATNGVVLGLRLLRVLGELFDGVPSFVEALIRDRGAVAQLLDAERQLFDLVLACERAFVRAGGAAADDPRLFDVGAIEGDDRAKAAADHAEARLGVVDDDDAPEQRVHERADAVVATDQPGSNADDAALLLQIEGVDVADGGDGQELRTALLAGLQRLDGFESGLLVLDEDGMEAVFEGGVNGHLEARGHAKLAGEKPDNARELGGLAQAARLEILDERLAHDEHIACARSNAIVLDLDAAQGFQATFEEVELTQVLVTGGLVVPDLVLDAQKAGANVLRGSAGGVHLVLGAEEQGAEVRETASVADELDEQLLPACEHGRGLAVELGDAAGGALRVRLGRPEAALIGVGAIPKLLSTAADGGVLTLRGFEGLSALLDERLRRLGLSDDLKATTPSSTSVLVS
jgi:hypothetical protein